MMNTNSLSENNTVITLIAETQGEMYDLAYKREYDIKDFSEKFLKSDFCRFEMDAVYSKYQTEFADECLNIVLEEFDNKGIQIKSRTERAHFSPQFIGMIYRYLYFYLKTSSDKLSDLISFEEIVNYSIELEEYDIEDVIFEIVSNIKNLQLEQSIIK